MRDFNIEIISPEKSVFTGRTRSVLLPAENGELGIMKDHAPILCSLKRGTVLVDTPEGEKPFEVTGGFAEFNGKNLTLLIRQERG